MTAQPALDASSNSAYRPAPRRRPSSRCCHIMLEPVRVGDFIIARSSENWFGRGNVASAVSTRRGSHAMLPARLNTQSPELCPTPLNFTRNVNALGSAARRSRRVTTSKARPVPLPGKRLHRPSAVLAGSAETWNAGTISSEMIGAGEIAHPCRDASAWCQRLRQSGRNLAHATSRAAVVIVLNASPAISGQTRRSGTNVRSGKLSEPTRYTGRIFAISVRQRACPRRFLATVNGRVNPTKTARVGRLSAEQFP